MCILVELTLFVCSEHLKMTGVSHGVSHMSLGMPLGGRSCAGAVSRRRTQRRLWRGRLRRCRAAARRMRMRSSCPASPRRACRLPTAHMAFYAMELNIGCMTNRTLYADAPQIL